MFAVLPLPPRARKPRGLPPKGPSLPRPSLQGGHSTSDQSKAHSVSFKQRRAQQDDRVDIAASGVLSDRIACRWRSFSLIFSWNHQHIGLSCAFMCASCERYKQVVRVPQITRLGEGGGT